MESEKSYIAPAGLLLNSANAAKFSAINGGFKLFFDYAASNDIFSLPEGRYELDGEKLFFTVSRNDLRPKEIAPLEAHRKYADIQILFEGGECFGLKDSGECSREKAPYDPLKDIVFFADKPDVFACLKPREFIVFMPHDAHAPLIGCGCVKKCVVKVRL